MIDNSNAGYYGNIEELRSRRDPGALKAVAKEMEALFAYELIKAMRESTGASPKEGLGGDAYMSMFDTELAKLFSERGLGLQDMLLQGLTRAAEKAAGQERDVAATNQGVPDSSLKDVGSIQRSLSASPPYFVPLPPQDVDLRIPSVGGNGPLLPGAGKELPETGAEARTDDVSRMKTLFNQEVGGQGGGDHR
ncbi:MAG TPA: rod-binding protein [Thermodesulfovibrionales bacterium]|nr:rod-binding protein [Thermodesulfovibrionales bacterium]